jgi:hypothetical protein
MNLLKMSRPVAIVVGILLIIGMVEFLVMRQLKNATASIVMDTLPGLSYGGKINAEVGGNFVRTLLVVTAARPEDRANFRQEISEASHGIDAALKVYEESIFEPEDHRLFDAMRDQRTKYAGIRQDVFGLIDADKKDEALSLFKNELLPVYKDHTRSCDMVFDYNMQQADSRGKHIMNVCSNTQLLVMIIGIAVFIGGLLTPFLAIASLKDPKL